MSQVRHLMRTNQLHHDAIYLVISASGANLLANEAAAVAFVHGAFAHLKVIGATSGSAALLDKAGVVPDAGVLPTGKTQTISKYLKRVADGRIWEREPSVRTVY